MRSRTGPNAQEITSHALYLRRREFVSGSLGGIAWAALGANIASPLLASRRARAGLASETLRHVPAARPPYRPHDAVTDQHDATHYNNFYELGNGKRGPARNADHLETEPWSIAIEGELARPGRFAVEDLIGPDEIEERIYRLRCVEAWSMVIPWLGVPLARILRRLEPRSSARYVAFESLLDPKNLPGQRSDSLRWPYREALRIDEAMHPLTLLAVGLYGEPLPPQNGAPLRLVVPWKYGFKSIKSIVRIRLQHEKPRTSWNEAAPREYGFYANVNPAVAHPRWSQARERRIGEWRKRATLPYNGYAQEVASLYRGMDLRREF